jgi:hypothetical protein
MKSPARTSRFRPEFDAFLFAPVGADESGMPLSVLSVLARMDLDPWQEAAQLAALPPESAAQKMSSILGAVPHPSVNSSDILLIATRLVATLPRPMPLLRLPLRAFPLPPGLTVTRAHANALILAAYLVFMIAIQLLITRHPAIPATAPLAPPSGSAPSAISPAPSTK